MRTRKFGENIVRLLWGKGRRQAYFCNKCHVVCSRLATPVTANDWGCKGKIMLHVHKLSHLQLLDYVWETLVEFWTLPIVKDR